MGRSGLECFKSDGTQHDDDTCTWKLWRLHLPLPVVDVRLYELEDDLSDACKLRDAYERNAVKDPGRDKGRKEEYEWLQRWRKTNKGRP